MATDLSSTPWWRRFERLFLTIGIALVGWAALSIAQATLFERTARRDFERAAAEPTPAVKPLPPASLAVGDMLGIVEIPRLGFSTIVVEGDSDEMLKVAAGHLPDTPPWQPGNTAIAGHRDGHFRPLKDIEIGDTIRLRTRHGTFDYRIKKTVIVLPSDISVLQPTLAKTLTLVTCYPFTYIGHAPKRFVIHAEALDAT
jgi:sortase A